jgi:hypothetical protein
MKLSFRTNLWAAGEIAPGAHAQDALECTVEVALIVKANVSGDVRKPTAGKQEGACPVDPRHRLISVGRKALMPFEGAH